MKTAAQARQEIMNKEIETLETNIKNIINDVIKKGGKTKVQINNLYRTKTVSKLSELGYEVTETSTCGFYNIGVY